MKIVLNKILFAALSLFALSSCMKDKVKGAGDAGTTIVKMMNPGSKVLAFDAVSTPQTAMLVDIRRDANSEASLNSSTSVTVTLDQAIMDTYNEDNGTAFEFLPAEFFTTDPGMAGNSFNLTFGPGEFAKPIKFTLKDATQLDFSKQYALPLTITTVDAGGKVSDSKSSMVIVLVKNTWDGAYEVTGTMKDEAADLGGLFPMNYHLITSGAVTVDGYDPDYWVDYFIPIMSGADVSGYGGYSPVFEFDPATNKVVKVTNIYGQPAANGRYASLDPSGENYYDPATKTIKVKFFMHQPASIPAAPHIRVKFDWTLKRTGDR